jgi:hypothetical protein
MKVYSGPVDIFNITIYDRHIILAYRSRPTFALLTFVRHHRHFGSDHNVSSSSTSFVVLILGNISLSILTTSFRPLKIAAMISDILGPGYN